MAEETGSGIGSKERVALDLAREIGEREQMLGANNYHEEPREYWLALYRDCLSATEGRPTKVDGDGGPRIRMI